MKDKFRKTLFSTADPKVIWANTMADHRLSQMHNCIDPLSRFSTWVMLVTGAIIAISVKYYSILEEIIPKDIDLFILLKYSLYCGFAAKIFRVFASLAFASVSQGMLETLRYWKELEDLLPEDAFAKRIENHPTQNDIVESIEAEMIARMPFPIRVVMFCSDWIKSKKKNNRINNQDDYGRYRIMVTANIMVIILVVAQTILFINFMTDAVFSVEYDLNRSLK